MTANHIRALNGKLDVYSSSFSMRFQCWDEGAANRKKFFWSYFSFKNNTTNLLQKPK